MNELIATTVEEDSTTADDVETTTFIKFNDYQEYHDISVVETLFERINPMRKPFTMTIYDRTSPGIKKQVHKKKSLGNKHISHNKKILKRKKGASFEEATNNDGSRIKKGIILPLTSNSFSFCKIFSRLQRGLDLF